MKNRKFQSDSSGANTSTSGGSSAEDGSKRGGKQGKVQDLKNAVAGASGASSAADALARGQFFFKRNYFKENKALSTGQKLEAKNRFLKEAIGQLDKLQHENQKPGKKLM